MGWCMGKWKVLRKTKVQKSNAALKEFHKPLPLKRILTSYKKHHASGDSKYGFKYDPVDLGDRP